MEWASLCRRDIVLCFAFLRAILDRYAYVPVVSEETTKLLKEKIGGRYISISDKVLYELPDMETIDGEVAFTMCQALLNNSALDISYIDAKGESSQRRIIPLRLINYAGKWYCIAFDSKSMELRTFSISRMDNVRAAGAPCFAIPSDDAIESYIHPHMAFQRRSARHSDLAILWGSSPCHQNPTVAQGSDN